MNLPEKSIFREEYFRNRDAQSIDGASIDRATKTGVALFAVTTVLLCSGILFFSFIKVQTYTRFQSVAESPKADTQIYSDRSGFVERLYVKEDQFVRSGELIFSINQQMNLPSGDSLYDVDEQRILTEVGLLKERIAQIDKEREDLYQSYQSEFSARSSMLALVTRQIELSKTQLQERRDRLGQDEENFAAGILVRRQLDAARDAVVSSEQLLVDKETEKSQIILQMEEATSRRLQSDQAARARINEIQSEIRRLESDLQSIKAQRAYLVTSPIDGVVAKSFVLEGEFVQPSQPVMIILEPTRFLVANIKVPIDIKPPVAVGDTHKVVPSNTNLSVEEYFYFAEVIDVSTAMEPGLDANSPPVLNVKYRISIVPSGSTFFEAPDISIGQKIEVLVPETGGTWLSFFFGIDYK